MGRRVRARSMWRVMRAPRSGTVSRGATPSRASGSRGVASQRVRADRDVENGGAGQPASARSARAASGWVDATTSVRSGVAAAASRSAAAAWSCVGPAIEGVEHRRSRGSAGRRRARGAGRAAAARSRRAARRRRGRAPRPRARAAGARRRGRRPSSAGATRQREQQRARAARIRRRDDERAARARRAGRRRRTRRTSPAADADALADDGGGRVRLGPVGERELALDRLAFDVEVGERCGRASAAATTPGRRAAP